LRAIRGVICARCKGGPKTIEFRGKRLPGRWHLVEICASCRQPWTQDESGEFDVPKAGGGPSPDPERHLVRDLDEYEYLRSIMDNRPRAWEADRWSFALQAWRVYLHPKIGSYQSAAEYANGLKVQPAFPEWWTRDIVWRWVNRARLVVKQRMGRGCTR